MVAGLQPQRRQPARKRLVAARKGVEPVRTKMNPLGGPLASLACAFGLIALPGCGGMKLVPVSGTVTQPDGKPLTQCSVSFNPDAAKGNVLTIACMGRLDAQGRYSLNTMGV